MNFTSADTMNTLYWNFCVLSIARQRELVWMLFCMLPAQFSTDCLAFGFLKGKWCPLPLLVFGSHLTNSSLSFSPDTASPFPELQEILFSFYIEPPPLPPPPYSGELGFIYLSSNPCSFSPVACDCLGRSSPVCPYSPWLPSEVPGSGKLALVTAQGLLVKLHLC